MDSKDIAKKLGSLGGKQTLKKYGKDHFKKIAKDRWVKVKEQNKTAPK